jgi:tetratricopeptide (TPR) repeat protein
MTFLERLLGGGRERALTEGVTLLEAGRYAEAVATLRAAARRRSAPAGSLAAYHFRQALLAESRRLLRAGDPRQAVPLLAEAVELWENYPDLHFLLGASRGLAGGWEEGLASARAALRLNPDYVEARLLEATALQILEREREAADSLAALGESGRRVQHWLLGRLARPTPYRAGDLPAGLPELLAAVAGGQSEKEEVAAAVALCRAGRWEEGLVRFGELVERQPRYPDYRTRYAAALFQLGRGEEALEEIEAALALNEDYGLAVNLKALVLADGGEVAAARRCLRDAAKRIPERDATRRTHEDLFGAYLRGVVALLTGHPEEVADLLAGWHDLVHDFGRAELLLAAAESLTAATATAGARLEALAREWSGESIYRWLWSCHLLENRQYEDLATALARWPVPPEGEQDWRPLYLEGHLAVCQGRVPARPVKGPERTRGVDHDPAAGAQPGPEAWAYLAARAAFLEGDDEASWSTCRDLEAACGPTERLVRLRFAAAAGVPDADRRDDEPVAPWPDSCLPGLVCAERRRHAAGADARLDAQRRLHPEDLRVNWLTPRFWLGPVRGWIA